MFDGKQVKVRTKLFYYKLLQIIDDMAPEKSERLSAKKVIGQPWMTKGLLKCAKKQLGLYKTAIMYKDQG